MRYRPLLSTAFIIAAIYAGPGRAAFDSGDAPESGPLEIIRITPDGEDAAVGNQIVIQFNRAVVPVGEMARDASSIPVTIKPDVSCEWRWINNSALACQLPDNAPLREATHYEMEIRPGIAAEDGSTLAETVNHSFITQRPYVYYKEFRSWRSASLPLIRLVFNQPVDKGSVTEHIFFAVGEKANRVAIAVMPDPQDDVAPDYMPVPGEPYAIQFDQSLPRKSDDDLRRHSGREARRVWLVEPVAELPADIEVTLKAEAGLESALGPEKSVDDDAIVTFDTFPEFAFLGVKCSSNNDEAILVPPGEKPSGKCDPMAPIQLSFSRPVEREEAGRALRFNPPIGGWVVEDEEAEEGDGEEGETVTEEREEEDASELGTLYSRSHEKGKTYEIWLPGGLKAAQDYALETRESELSFVGRLWHRIRSWFVDVEPITVTDIFGEAINGPVAAQFTTDHRRPNYVLDYNSAVLEKGVADSEVPLYVNNLDSYSMDYRRVTPNNKTENFTFEQKVPQVEDIQFAVPLGVREMLQGKSGAFYGALHTEPQVGTYVPTLFAQVTPYQVHFKLGHFSSLAWVTDLASGEPVEGAKVTLYRDSMEMLGNGEKAVATVTTDASGMALLPGTDMVDPDINFSEVWGDGELRYFLRVEKGEDMALLPTGGAFKVYAYSASGDSVYPSTEERYGHMQAWGTTAQGIYRVGDTIQYKIFVRNQDTNRFIPAPDANYVLKITDPTGKVAHEEKGVKPSKFGGISGEFTVPKEAAVGWYQFKLIAYFAEDGGPAVEVPTTESDEHEDESWQDEEDPYYDDALRKTMLPMRVLVSDFTPSPFRVTNELNGDLFHAGEEVKVSTQAALHSGGAYGDAGARITALLDAATFESDHPLAKGFYFDSYQGELSNQQLYQNKDMVDGKGEIELTFSIGTPKVVYGKLMVESAVMDDRGKYVTGQSRADYFGVDRLVGLRSNDWLYTVGKPAAIKYVVVDESGAPVAGSDVAIKFEHQVQKAARVKGAGNAYLTEYHTEWEAAGSCNGTSEADALTCEFTPEKSGSYRAVASIKDTKGNEHTTTIDGYAIGSDYVLWDNGSDSSLTIVPERTDYKVGETARYLVKNPYPGAKALITVERYGILDQFVQTFDGSTPVIELEVKPDYVPGFYLSVVIMSPRVEKPLGEGQVDLGKPTYRMGYIEVPVKDPVKEMIVTAKTDKEVYKPRETVNVEFHAEPRQNNENEPIELTVTVLDESVFDLVAGGENYFNPYTGFYKLADLDVRNYSLLTRLVGRQRFEKKGANPGGDGGADLNMRSVFKFVSYWNAQLTTDTNGNAKAAFEAPDNLTGWRILAIATTPTDRFGLGDANFKVNRPTEVRPAMPNQVLEGDRFDAGFSVMNRTDKKREINVTIEAEGNFDGDKTPAQLNKTIELAPYKRTTVYMPIQTTALAVARDQAEGSVRFTVRAEDAMDGDALAHSLPVRKRRSLETAAHYGTTTQDHIEESVRFPEGILEDVGGVSVVASPTVIGNISGAFKYVRDYPYLCWEQRLTKGVMAAHYQDLRSYLPDDLSWKDSKKMPQAMLEQAASFQAPNGGMTYFIAQDGYVDPYLSAYTALAFNWLRESGYDIPEPVEKKLQGYLKNILKNNAAPDFYSEGMTSTVRAVALAALAERGEASLEDLERYQPHVKQMSLFGKAHFLQAALAIKGGERFAPDVTKSILSAANQTGGKFVFSETWDDSYARILASPLRENCAVLNAFTRYGEREKGGILVGDVPFKLMRSITQSRGNRDHWENTQENMFCLNAMIEFARLYEKDKTDMTVSAMLDDEPIGSAEFHDVRDPAATLERPTREGDAGRSAKVHINRQGSGRLYYATRLSFAMPAEHTKAANAGIEMTREYSVQREGKWQILKAPAAEIKRGELVRVDLFISVPTARNFVVVDDPIPGGLEPVNRDLATASEVDMREGDYEAAGGSFWFKYSDWQEFGVSRWSFYHQELRHDAARFYSDYLPAGNYHLSYTAQAIATGSFDILPGKAEEMYDPDVFGRTDGLKLQVGAPQSKQ